jgi:protocatechuate 3,4-dioxygenase beta subunit
MATRSVLVLAAFCVLGTARGSVSQKPAARVAAAAPRPAPTATSLEVVVSDAAGKPVAGAFVMAVPVSGGYSMGGVRAEKLRSTLTSGDGRAKLEAMPAGPWSVTVHARGHVVKRLPRVAAGPLAVRLERGASISGSVRAADGGRPIAGARVRVAGASPLPAAWQVEATRNEAQADAQGRFRLEGIGRSPVAITARAAGFGAATRRDVRAGDSVDLFLFPGATLSGSVRDEQGRPVAGALVRADSDGLRAAPQAETTDAQGAFVMAGLPPGEYVVVARGGPRAPGIASALVEPESEASVSLVLSDGGYATGQIVDAGAGRPLSGRVKLEVFEERGLSSAVSDALSAESGADGRFTLGPLPLGALGIGVSAPGHAARRVELTIPARGRSLDLGQVPLETGLLLRGRVVEREGNGVAGAQVRASTPGRAERSEGEAVTETDGAFEIGGLRAGPHEVVASAAGHASARTKAEPGGPPVRLVLEPGGEIVGRVVDALGQPVEDARVEARPMDEAPYGLRDVSAESDEGDGRFALRDVGAGSYVLQARASGRGEASLAAVRVAPGRPTDVGTVTLARGGVVAGVVVDADGRGIPGASVRLEKDLSRQTNQLETQTGPAGTFELRGVPPGRINVLVRHPSFAAVKPVVADVDPEKDPTPLRIVLPRGARLEGRASKRDGSPFTAGRITVSSSELGPAMGWDPAAIAADGSFAVDHLAAGWATVNLMAFTPTSTMGSGRAGNVLTGIATQDVELREGETSTVSFALRDVIVAGRVTRGGQPAAGVHVSLVPFRGGSMMMWGGAGVGRAVVPGSGPPPLNATAREDGSFELVVFSPGRYRADLTLLATGQRQTGRELDLPDVERYEVELEVADTTLTGVVVDKETGQPLTDAQLSLRQVGPRSWRGSAMTGQSGRFTIAAEAGDYQLYAQAPKYEPFSLPVTVGPEGLSDVRLEMERGLAITGRVVDEAGRPQGEVEVTATRPDGRSEMGESLPDGRFRIEGLDSATFALVAGSGTRGFAVRPGTTPDAEPVTLVLRPPGRLAIRVLAPDGRPIKGAWPTVQTWSGVAVDLPYTGASPTDANGACELSVPAGSVMVRATGEGMAGFGGATVGPGQAVPLEIRLSDVSKENPRP